MLRVGVLAALASGCGRFSFDAAADASGDTGVDVALGHDEDGDGIPDSADFCPHVASAANSDSDGDGVGDVCDPEPALARQSWTYFSPMTGAIPFALGPDGAWTMNADDYHYIDAPGQAQIIRAGMVSNVDVWVGLDVEAVGTGGVQAAIIINGTNTPYWYGELFDGGSGARVSITEYTGSIYVARSTMSLGTAFPVGAIDLHLAARPGVGLTYTAAGGTTMFAATGYAGDTLIIIALGHHSGRVRYLAIIESQ